MPAFRLSQAEPDTQNKKYSEQEYINKERF